MAVPTGWQASNALVLSGEGTLIIAFAKSA